MSDKSSSNVRNPTVGPTRRKPGDDRRSESMADPEIHDGAARQPGGPEPSGEDGAGNTR